MGPTQAALAEQFAVTWNTVARWETGSGGPEIAVRLLACLAPSGSNELDPESERLWVCSSAVRARAGLATVASTAGRAVFAVSASAGQVDGPNIRSKAEADAALDDLRTAIKGSTLDDRGLQPAPQAGPLPFRELAALYKERHVIGTHFTLARAIDYRLKPLLEHFGDRPIAEIRTADVQDFIADLRKRRIVHGRSETRPLANASISRSIELLRHMLNWAVGRGSLDRTPFRRGTETLIRKLREDNRRHTGV